jgi:hypothetical protein
MTKKPHDTKPQEEAENATAVDSVRTNQELDAPKVKQQAEADPAAARQAETDASPSGKSHPKVYRSKDEGPMQDTPVEPNVEDEP